MARVKAHVFISGRVQGVFFRANTEVKAKEIGLSGWVRNLDDGRVEAVFEGEKARVEKMIEWCEGGSPRAEVSDVKVSWGESEGLGSFEIRR